MISSNYSGKLNWKVISFSLVIGITGIALMWLCSQFIPDTSAVIKNLLLATLGSLVVSTFLLALWEIVAKKSFAEEILELADISSNINASGLEQVYVNFKEINWREIIESCDKMTIAFAYGQTWRNSHSDVLAAIPEKDGSLIVYLPNFEDIAVVDSLSRRFSTSSEEAATRIRESANFFHDIGATVYLFSGTFQSSYYIIDKMAIMSFYNHHKSKNEVPAIRSNSSGNLFKFIEEEIAAIERNSTLFSGASNG